MPTLASTRWIRQIKGLSRRRGRPQAVLDSYTAHNPGTRGLIAHQLGAVAGAYMSLLLLAAGCLWATCRPAQAEQWLDPWQAQTGGWLQLTLDQARYRQQEAEVAGGLSPEAAANLGLIERQEWLDRRALDQREAQWTEDARRRERLPGVGNAWTSPAATVLRMRIERAEADERLRRDLRRQSSGPLPAPTPNPPPPFQLR
jgi:hypothetical protein